MKGIILSAGKGTRLYPSTMSVPKALMPVYDKPLIYYPLSILIEMDIKEVLVIIAPDTQKYYSDLLGDGSRLGMNISYKVQPVAKGIADGLIIAEEFLAGDSCCFVLGDNILYGEDMSGILEEVRGMNIEEEGAAVFGHWVEDPRAFGVVEFDDEGKVLSIEEKPAHPKSNYIIPGIYFYDGAAPSMAKTLTPSGRGELEITDLNKLYLEKDMLHVIPLSQSGVWFDAGTADNLLAASVCMSELHMRGEHCGYVEALAYHMDFISKEEYLEMCKGFKNEYGKYLLSVIED